MNQQGSKEGNKEMNKVAVEFENSSFMDRSSINLSKISSNQATFCRNDESTNSTLMIEAILGKRETPKLFKNALMKENLRANKSLTKEASLAKKGAPVKVKIDLSQKVLIDLRENSLSSSIESTTFLSRSKKNSNMSSSAQLMKMPSVESTNVKVFGRIKPSSLEETLQRKYLLEIQPNYVRIDSSIFTFDEMFGETATQQQIFQKVAKPMISDVFNGFNGTIFAYGQTGSGKTYTMFGNHENKGMIPKTVERVFEHLEEITEGKYTIKASMLQIYKQNLSDLFNIQPCPLKIKQSPNGIYVEGLVEEQVHNAKTLLGLIDFGEQIRKVSSTRVNQYSSRSHTIIMINIRGQFENGQHKFGKLYLVDLAGSQKVRRSGAEGETLEEAKKINLSLSCLGNVINALTTRKKKDHIPYRDSKLTRILQDSLSGNCKTSLIINFSGAQNCIQQTISALKFAQRAKMITNTVKINSSQRESVDQLYAIISDLQKQLKQTKNQLQKYKQNEEQYEQQAPSARLVIPSERANVQASLNHYKSRGTMRHLKLSINLEELSSLNASNDSRINSTLHSPSLSCLSVNRSVAFSKDYSLNFSIKNDDLSESSSVRMEPEGALNVGCMNPFRK